MATQRARQVRLVAAAALVAACGRAQTYEPPPTPVRVQVVETYASGGGLRYSANIRPATQVEPAFRMGGYVEHILQVEGPDGRRRDVQEGDRVAKDTVLARVRESDYRIKLDQLRPSLAEAQAAGEAAQAQLAEAQAGAEAARFQLTEALAASEGARSQLAEAQAALQQAQLDLDRATRLLESRSITKPDYDAAKARADVLRAKVDGATAQVAAIQARVEAARAQVRMSEAKIGAARIQPRVAEAGASRARAQLAEAEVALRDSALRAPLDGVVLKRNVEIGMLVGPGVPAFVIAETGSVKAVFGVADTMVGQLRPGAALSITTEALPGEEFRGRLTRVAPAADPKTRVFEVEVTIPNPQDRLKVGMIATLMVGGSGSAQPVPVVPLSALVRPKTDPAGFAVFVLDRQGAAEVARLRTVKLGEAYGNTIAVAHGLRAGERVIVTGGTLVNDGQPVQVIP